LHALQLGGAEGGGTAVQIERRRVDGGQAIGTVPGGAGGEVAVEVEIDHALCAGAAVQLESLVQRQQGAADGGVAAAGFAGRGREFIHVQQASIAIDARVAVAAQGGREFLGRLAIPPGDVGQPGAQGADGRFAALMPF
jgi:hypothetical protein